MGSFSIWHWVIVLVVVLVLFGGGGKLSMLMGDMARGIGAFRKGLKEDAEGHAAEQRAEQARLTTAQPTRATQDARKDVAA